MRIGTWNLANKWSDRHRELLQSELCDVWLLTEVNPRAANPHARIAGFNCHLSSGIMTCKQHWAAVLSRQTLSPLPDPHPASAAAIVNGITYCATILPWAGCAAQPPCPWVGDTLGEMVKTGIECLTDKLPKLDLVWGGDWNQNLTGGWENVGSTDGQKILKSAIESLNLQVPTAGLLHRLGTHSIDHIAVPSGWRVTAARAVPVAAELSDHDAYVIDVIEIQPLASQCEGAP